MEAKYKIAVVTPGLVTRHRKTWQVRQVPHPFDVAIKTIVGRVDLPADEPYRPWAVPLEDLLPRLKPVKLFGGCGAKCLRILSRVIENARAPDVGRFLELLGRRKVSLFVQENLDGLVCHDASSFKRIFNQA
jgi:hypothetical protein